MCNSISESYCCAHGGAGRTGSGPRGPALPEPDQAIAVRILASCCSVTGTGLPEVQ